MTTLTIQIRKEKFRKIPFKISKTQHIVIKAKINNVSGNFILDTGASNSCVGFESVEKFLLKAKESATTASGAGANGMSTQESKNNSLQIGTWKWNKSHLIIFDMTHVNNALIEHKTKIVDGIIGADVLLAGKAIIDYDNKILYLKTII